LEFVSKNRRRKPKDIIQFSHDTGSFD
jgi:hypothetical protein